jgi:rRNA maturation endonuclease Nob1
MKVYGIFLRLTATKCAWKEIDIRRRINMEVYTTEKRWQVQCIGGKYTDSNKGAFCPYCGHKIILVKDGVL